MDCLDDYGEDRRLAVKFRSTVYGGNRALIAELLASLLASALSIPVAAPFIVDCDASLGEAVADAHIAKQIRESAGFNFGSEFLQPARTVPPRWPLSGVYLDEALKVFFLDAIIQNADRSELKPNLLVYRGGLIVIDHEQALPFMHGAVGREPWVANELTYLRNHIFYSGLRGKTLDFGEIATLFVALDELRIQEHLNVIPKAWRLTNKDCQMYINYISTAQSKLSLIINNLNDFLR
jgi:hypothetical protein